MKKGLIIGIIVILLIALGIFYYFHLNSSHVSSPVCIKAGEIYQNPAVLGKILGECCGNLTIIKELQIPLAGNSSCESLSDVAGGGLICSACGNNVCEAEWENKCNCPQDCETNCHSEGEVYSTMPLPNGKQDSQSCCGNLKMIYVTDSAVCTSSCGNNVCDLGIYGIGENNLNCPQDCK